MKNTSIIAIIIAFLAGALGVGAYTLFKKSPVDLAENTAISSAYVEDVIDGDTIKIESNVRVRFIGINSPEKGTCFYGESREFARKLLLGKEVRLERDISGVDKFDRLLRYVILPSGDPEKDDVLVNDYFVRQGIAQAVASPPDNRYRDLFSSAQEEAKREKRGLWEACDYGESAESLREVDTEPTDPACIIKGNISEKGYGKTYLTLGCDNYNRVKIDTRKGEQYFCSEEEAEAAGFRKATNCP